jgi:hypothetical protein
VRGSSGQGVGWLQSLSDRVRGLRAQMDGIQRRLTSPLVDGVPAAVSGEVTFKAATQEQIEVQYPIAPQEGANSIIPILCNPIVKAGQTYRIPVMFPPPGVLSVQNLVVTMEAGMVEYGGINRPYIYALNDYLQTQGDFGGGFDSFGSPLPYRYTWQQQILGTVWNTMPYLPFFWNIIDEKSGRQYAQDWMPHGALLNTRGNNNYIRVAPDSELYDFDTPWLFERDAQISFLFRPIMDLYQVDASATYPTPPGAALDVVEAARRAVVRDTPILPYESEDRNQGKRNQQLTVRVEMHGIRHYDRQDVLKQGAYV